MQSNILTIILKDPHPVETQQVQIIQTDVMHESAVRSFISATKDTIKT